MNPIGVGMAGSSVRAGNENFEEVKRIKRQFGYELREELTRVGNDPISVLGYAVNAGSVQRAMAHMQSWADGKYGLRKEE